ncbi:hypothetical protein RI367_006884 [Sorochytrium milnesiophthora]
MISATARASTTTAAAATASNGRSAGSARTGGKSATTSVTAQLRNVSLQDDRIQINQLQSSIHATEREIHTLRTHLQHTSTQSHLLGTLAHSARGLVSADSGDLRDVWRAETAALSRKRGNLHVRHATRADRERQVEAGYSIQLTGALARIKDHLRAGARQEEDAVEASGQVQELQQVLDQIGADELDALLMRGLPDMQYDTYLRQAEQQEGGKLADAEQATWRAIQKLQDEYLAEVAMLASERAEMLALQRQYQDTCRSIERDLMHMPNEYEGQSALIMQYLEASAQAAGLTAQAAYLDDQINEVRSQQDNVAQLSAQVEDERRVMAREESAYLEERAKMSDHLVAVSTQLQQQADVDQAEDTLAEMRRLQDVCAQLTNSVARQAQIITDTPQEQAWDSSATLMAPLQADPDPVLDHITAVQQFARPWATEERLVADLAAWRVAAVDVDYAARSVQSDLNRVHQDQTRLGVRQCSRVQDAVSSLIDQSTRLDRTVSRTVVPEIERTLESTQGLTALLQQIQETAREREQILSGEFEAKSARVDDRTLKQYINHVAGQILDVRMGIV